MGEILRFDAAPRWIEPETLRDALVRGDAIAVIDVRGLSEFFCGTLGRLPSAINVPLSELAGCLSALMRLRERRVVLMSIRHDRAMRAAAHLGAAGFSHVRVLRGGMERWHRLGYPCVRAPTSRRAS